MYLVVPHTVTYGARNTFYYYYNNAMPINFKYQLSTLKSMDLYSRDVFDKLPQALKMTLAETYLDAKTLKVAFTNNLINKMYSDSKMSTMNWLIILGAVVVVILIFLQVFGVIDIGSLLGVKTK